MSRPKTLTDVVDDMAAAYLEMRAEKLDLKEAVRKIRALVQTRDELVRKDDISWISN